MTEPSADFHDSWRPGNQGVSPDRAAALAEQRRLHESIARGAAPLQDAIPGERDIVRGPSPDRVRAMRDADALRDSILADRKTPAIPPRSRYRYDIYLKGWRKRSIYCDPLGARFYNGWASFYGPEETLHIPAGSIKEIERVKEES